jgi:hypothetical protein
MNLSRSHARYGGRTRFNERRRLPTAWTPTQPDNADLGYLRYFAPAAGTAMSRS